MPPTAPPEVSVIIPTLNRARRLERVLGDLLHQTTHRPYEIIVVDNGSTDATSALVRRLVVRQSRALATPVREIYEPRPGASHARNAGPLSRCG